MSEKEFCEHGDCPEVPTLRLGRRSVIKALAGGVLGAAGFLGWNRWSQRSIRNLNQVEADAIIKAGPQPDDPDWLVQAIEDRDADTIMQRITVGEPGKLATLAGYCNWQQACDNVPATCGTRYPYRQRHRCVCCAPSHPCVYGAWIYGACRDYCYGPFTGACTI